MAWVFFLQRRDEQRHACCSTASPPRCWGCREPRRPSGAPPPATTLRPRSASCSRSGCPDRRRARRGPHGTARGRQPLPHAARGGRLRRRAEGAARRPGRRRPARGARGHRARRARRALARRLRPALPDRDRAPREPSTTSWSGPRRPPRSGATPSRPPRASRAREGRPPPPRGSAHRDARGRRSAAAQGTDALRVEAAPSAGRRGRRPSARRRCRRRCHGPRAGPRARRAPASATCRPAAWASATNDASASGESHVQQPAAVLDGGVEQADPGARRARDARQQLGRERRVRHAPGVRVGGRHHHGAPATPSGPRAAERPRRPRSRRPTGRPSRTSLRCAPRPGRRAPPCRAGWACRRSRR